MSTDKYLDVLEAGIRYELAIAVDCQQVVATLRDILLEGLCVLVTAAAIIAAQKDIKLILLRHIRVILLFPSLPQNTRNATRTNHSKIQL
jgi:hypothetical protein